MSFVWDDPFLLEDQLSEEERMIRDAAAAFAKAELSPALRTCTSTRKLSADCFPSWARRAC